MFWPVSNFSCCRMYSRTRASSRPTVLTQYPTDQKCKPYTRFSCIWRWIRTALLPLRNPITNATPYFGGIQAHVHVVAHHVPLDQLHALLPAQLPQDRADLRPKLPEQQLLPVLRYDHHVVLAFPLHVGQTLPLVHMALLA